MSGEVEQNRQERYALTGGKGGCNQHYVQSETRVLISTSPDKIAHDAKS